MNIEKQIKEKQLIQELDKLGFDTENKWYHVTQHEFTEFDIDKFNDKNIWMTRDIDTIDNGETGAGLTTSDPSKIKILKCFIKKNIKIGDWDDQDKYFDQQLEQMGFDGILLDDDIKLFSSDNVIILDDKLEEKILKLKESQKSKQKSSNKLNN